ncbi:unnamed protein product [Anisakis simplex]|uniref:LsmAD domain-containing protein n=1 Tax=Anisakis simplex TaxID=6269 RepID=A0A0M3K3W4_ANISI|nr:unnamed protein product [Anisakis simplex]
MRCVSVCKGRDVLLETRDGRKYEGIFAGCSQDFDVGLRLAHELRSDDVNQLLPLKSNVIEKLAFGPADVLCMSVLMHDEKRIKGFATDQEYQKTAARNGVLEDGLEMSNEFEVWEADGNDDEELEGAVDAKGGLRVAGTGSEGSTGGGWSVDDMFNANNALGVKSTFEDNLSQYTTANIEGDGEARLRAERIAQEIEMNPASRARARMENDDEERDLNKETPEFQVHSHRKNQNAAGRNNYSSNPRGAGLQSGGGSNRGGGHAMSGRRSDGSGSGQRQGRGGMHSGGGSVANMGSNATSRSFTNSSLTSSSHSVKGGSAGAGVMSQSATGGSSSTQGGRFQPPPERPSAQAVHNEFGQWSEMRTGGAITAGGGVSGQKMGNARRSDTSLQQQSNANKLYDANHRNNAANQHTSHSSVNRTSGSQTAMNKGSSSGAVKGGAQTERVKGLRDFHQNFNNTYHSNAQSHEEQQKGLSSNVVAPVPTTAAKTTNAWNKGPPASIRSAAAAATAAGTQSQLISAGVTPHAVPGAAATANQTLKLSQSSDQLRAATQQAVNNQPSASSQPTTPLSSVPSSQAQPQTNRTKTPPSSTTTSTKVIATDRSSDKSIPTDSSQSQHKPTGIPPTAAAGTSQKSAPATSASASVARGSTPPSRTTPSTSPVQSSTAPAPTTIPSQASAPSTGTGAVMVSSSQSAQQAHSNAGTPTPTVLSGTASSSSIAPIDPTPTVTTAAPGSGTTSAASTMSTAQTVTAAVTSTASSSGGGAVKKFEFNPDAQPFTPRSIATAQGLGLVGAGGLQGMQTLQGLTGGVGMMQALGQQQAQAQAQAAAAAAAVSLQQQQQQQQLAAAVQQPLLAGVTPHSNATAAVHAAAGVNAIAPQTIPIAQGLQPGQLVAHAAPPQMFPYAAGAGVYGTAVPVYYGAAQPMMQAGTAQIAPGVNVTMSGAPGMGGGSMGQGGGATPRGVAQLGGISNASNGAGGARRGQQTLQQQQQQSQQAQQQLIQSGAGMYVPAGQMAAAAGYPQQMLHAAQYQVPFYTTTPYQQMSLASANVPPPTVPPPTSSSVAVAGAPPQSFQVVQAQTPHQQALYSRQLYQGAQPLQFPIFSAAQTAGSYVVYTGAGGHQSMMQMHPHPSALQTNPHSQNQTGHHGHPQVNNNGSMDQQQSHSQMNSSGGTAAPQSYAITSEQQHQLQQFVHPQQSAAIFQQQQAAVVAASLVRQNSLNNAAAAAQQNASYQSSHPNGWWALRLFCAFLTSFRCDSEYYFIVMNFSYSR